MVRLEDIRTRNRVIHALLAREAKKRFGNNLVGLLGAFIEPLVLVAVFGSIFYFTGREGAHSSDILAFMVTGVMPFHLFSKIFTRSMGALDANKTLLSYPIMRPVDPILARCYLEFLIYVTTYILLMEACFFFELIDGVPRIEFVLMGLGLATLLGLGMGMLSASILALTGAVKTVVPVFNRALFLTSGVFFSASMLPQFARDIFLWNPMLNVTEMVRHGTFVNFPSVYFDAWYVLAVAIAILTLGIVLLNYVEHNPKARVRGG